MAALTLSEKAKMIAKESFRERMRTAIITKANYWKNVTPGALSDYNLRMQKRKQFSFKYLKGVIPSMEAYSAFFLDLYQETTPDLITGTSTDLDGQLTDAVLTSGTWQDPALDFFAGVVAGDETAGIIW